jgi:hypothetical protein
MFNVTNRRDRQEARAKELLDLVDQVNLSILRCEGDGIQVSVDAVNSVDAEGKKPHAEISAEIVLVLGRRPVA